MVLSDVSKTAILTLLAHAAASENRSIDYYDPMAILSLERLNSIASPEEKKWITRQKRLISAPDARAMARRVKAFDRLADHFISSHPNSTVLNLGCGFDTRYWRIDHKDCRYVEIDLPEVVALKKEVLKDQLEYELLGYSVLDVEWIDRVISEYGNRDYLLLAEGLFMFLPEPEVKDLIHRLAQKFLRSQLVVEMASEKWTRGFWKMVFALQARVWGLDVSFASWIADPHEVESYSEGLSVLDVVKGSSVGPIIVVSINPG